MNAASAGIVISGVIDGTTLAYSILVVEADLTPTTITQYFSESEFVPDWAATWAGSDENAKATLPRIVVKVRDPATNADLTRTVSITSVYYNGEAMTFGDDGISTGLVMPGVIRKTTIDYGTGTAPCLQLVGNPASALLNPDADTIEISGTVVCDGGQMSFSRIPVTLPIRPIDRSSGGYSVELLTPTDCDVYIYTDPGTNLPVPTKRIAQLRLDNKAVNAELLTGYSVRWFDITGPDEVELTDGANILFSNDKMKNDTITIREGAVDSMMSFAARVYDADGEPVASGTSTTIDYTDPWWTKWVVKNAAEAADGTEYAGVTPEIQLRRNQQRYLFPKLYNSNGEYPSALTWTFNFDDGETGDTITGIQTGTDSGGNSYCVVGYSDVVVGGVSRKIIVNAQTEL